MSKKVYAILTFISGIKGDDDKVRYSIEPEDGGGIEFVADTKEEAIEYAKSQNADYYFY